LLLLLLVTSLILAACGPTEAPAPPAEKKVATFIWTQEFDNLNPMYTGMWFSTISQQIWNCDPWDWDDTDSPHPVLVAELPSLENGGISEDGKTITLKLRDDIVWSDGEPITSDDFVFTHAMFTDPANAVNSTYPYDQFTSIEAPDERTVVITFDEPFVPWMASIFVEILPAHVLRPVFEAEGSLDEAEWNYAPTVGCGPYVFTEWETGSFASFVRNENYYNEPAKIDEIFIRFVPDDASQVAALRTGEGDLGTFISYSDIPTLEEAGVEIAAVASGYNEGWYIYFGEEAHPALADKNVRQAIAMCYDRFSLVDDLLLGLTDVAASFWHKTPWAAPGLEPLPYDPEQANALLDEAGWVDSNGDGVRDKDGEELVLVHGTTTREIRADQQAVAQQQLAECGIQLDITGYASDVFFTTYGEGAPCSTGQLDICEWSASPAYPDPDSSRWLCSEIPSDEFPDGVNDQHLCDEKLDELFQLQATQVDFAERQATFHEISNYMADNVYWLGIWYDPDVWAVSGRLENVKISGATPFFSVAEWDLE
jgi:peptide/nickel transport system substrate-binding protein